jgi:hypothetical protein
MKLGFLSVMPALVLVACKKEPTNEKGQVDVGQPSTAQSRSQDIHWPDRVEDVDCSRLLGSDAQGVEPRHACADADQKLPMETVDELHHRYMWKLFMRLAEEEQLWKDEKDRTETDRYALIPGQLWEKTGSGVQIIAGLNPQATGGGELHAGGGQAYRVIGGSNLKANRGDATVFVARPKDDCIDPDPKTLAVFRAPSWSVSLDASSHRSPPLTNPLWDQNGNRVEFEVVLVYSDPKVKTAQRQMTDMCTNLTRLTRWGSLAKQGKQGPVHLKLAWRDIVSEEECKYGFIIEGGGACTPGAKGLVAIHIVTKLQTQGDFWLWGTFSHVSNVEEQNGLPPLFRDPACSDCEDNKCPKLIDGKRRTQIARIKDIPGEVRATKRAGIDAGEISGVYQNYDLLGVQRLPGIAKSETIPDPRPATLANEIIEWDRQNSSCIGCHSWARVASFDIKGENFEEQHDQICDDMCDGNKCDACGHEQVCRQATCGGACAEVVRRIRFSRSNRKPHLLSDLAWIYDHCWFNQDSEECK